MCHTRRAGQGHRPLDKENCPNVSTRRGGREARTAEWLLDRLCCLSGLTRGKTASLARDRDVAGERVLEKKL